jgi:hypothetical protein
VLDAIALADEPLDRLALIRHARLVLRLEERRLARLALHDRRVSYAAVGRALGISRQHARRLYGLTSEPYTPR